VQNIFAGIKGADFVMQINKSPAIKIICARDSLSFLGKGGLCIGPQLLTFVWLKTKAPLPLEIKSKNFHYLMNWAALGCFSLFLNHNGIPLIVFRQRLCLFSFK